MGSQHRLTSVCIHSTGDFNSRLVSAQQRVMAGTAWWIPLIPYGPRGGNIDVLNFDNYISKRASLDIFIYLAYILFNRSYCFPWALRKFLIFFFFFGSIGVWIEGLALARQVLYIAMSLALYNFSYFSDRVSCPLPMAGLGSQYSYICLCVAGILDVYHHVWLVCWDGGVSNFLPS
jgi:hypothetical protein